jgi:hypothetical protein
MISRGKWNGIIFAHFIAGKKSACARKGGRTVDARIKIKVKGENYERLNNSINPFNYFTHRRIADVALQRWLGLLSKRRFGIGGFDSSDLAFARQIMMSREG